MPRRLFPLALTLISLVDPAAAQIVLQPPYSSAGAGYGGLQVDPRIPYGGATVVTPGALLNNAPVMPLSGSAPCAPSQVSPLSDVPAATPATSSMFRPPITPSYRAFTDRFAGPPQPGSIDANTGGCR